MAIGYICPCCGESGERPEDVDAAVMFMCAPTEKELRDTKSPNYIEVAPDGSMSIVLNAYKNDRRSSSTQFDPDSADFVLDNPRRYKLKANPVLTKYGFSPEDASSAASGDACLVSPMSIGWLQPAIGNLDPVSLSSYAFCAASCG
eukprot:COSAG03_NODE_2442_length_2760_cov_1919.337467_2_plen_146_part_00